MIARLRGLVVHIDVQTHAVVVECAGVGYGLLMSLRSIEQLPPLGEPTVVHVATLLSQDALRLYGFTDKTELAVFELLLLTTGVGARLALTILSALSPDNLYMAVAQRDIALLTRIPKVGKKKAERLVLELQDRLKHWPVGRENVNNDVATVAPQPLSMQAQRLHDVSSALCNLGFNEAQAVAASRKAWQQCGEDGTLPLTSLLRLALQVCTGGAPSG